MTLHQLMTASYKHPEAYNRCRITETKTILVKLVLKHRKMTTQKLSELKTISAANASNQLNLLYKEGWLTRKQLSDPSGGICYEYRCEPEQWGKR